MRPSQLELGCGNGLTANLLAASLPRGEFHAVDLKPEHIANARRMADRGRLSNVDLIEDSVGGLLDRKLPGSISSSCQAPTAG